MILGDSTIEYNDSFRLYILTRDGNPKLLPELCIKVLVVNFIITTEGITEQILSKIVEHENPGLEEQRNEILKTLVVEKSRLTHLESTLLELIHNSYGNILDDDVLIQTLFESKNTAKEIKIRVEKSEITEIDLEKQRRTYLPLAQRGALLFFVAVDLTSLNVIYQFSLALYFEMFCRCIVVPKHDRPSSARVCCLFNFASLCLSVCFCLSIYLSAYLLICLFFLSSFRLYFSVSPSVIYLYFLGPSSQR